MPIELITELIETTNKKGQRILKRPTDAERLQIQTLKKDKLAKAETQQARKTDRKTETNGQAKIEANTTSALSSSALSSASKKETKAVKSNDISDFIKDSELLLVSDFEGTTPTIQFKKFKDYVTTKKVIYLGDIFDSTATGSFPNTDPDYNHPCIKDKNYCALQSVKLLVDNSERCQYVVGNRDLNKIKLWRFFQYKTGETWWKTSPSYEATVDALLVTEDENKNVWKVETMDYFKPFWNEKKWNGSTEKRKSKDYKNSIYDRFEALFGEDGVLGTMSAIVTLKSIPNEMFYSVKSTIDKFIEKMKYAKKPNITDIDNYKKFKSKVRAALVISVFMRMLDKDLWKEKGDTSVSASVGEFKAMDGYLYKYLTNAKPAYYADNNKNLLLFAHGGITKAFVLGNGTKATDLLNSVQWKDVLQLEKKGGGKNPITTSIDTFNQQYDTLLNDFFDTTKKDEDYKVMLTLLQLSAAFEVIAEKTNKKNELTMDLSPIQRKDASTEILDEFIGDYDGIFNIFGHASVSEGYSFGAAKSGVKTYYINTDYSSTLFKNELECNQDTYNNNFLLLNLNTKTQQITLTLAGEIHLNASYKQITKADLFKDKEKEKKGTDIFTTCYAYLQGKKQEKENFYYIDDDNAIDVSQNLLIFTYDAAAPLDKSSIDGAYALKDNPMDVNQFSYNGIATFEAYKNKKFSVFSSRFNFTVPNKLFIFMSKP